MLVDSLLWLGLVHGIPRGLMAGWRCACFNREFSPMTASLTYRILLVITLGIYMAFVFPNLLIHIFGNAITPSGAGSAIYVGEILGSLALTLGAFPLSMALGRWAFRKLQRRRQQRAAGRRCY